jgi:hypothetical protein
MAYFFILVRVVSRQSVSLFERAKSNQKPAEQPMVLGLSFDSSGLAVITILGVSWGYRTLSSCQPLFFIRKRSGVVVFHDSGYLMIVWSLIC